MTTLDAKWFLDAVPAKPTGKYAHIMMLRVTDSYSLFQTDGELNTARVQAGATDSALMTRITMFKRKQTTAERLVGRELLRRYGFLSDLLSGDTRIKINEDNVKVDPDGKPVCDYNVDFCKTCPDCITYGFAIGDSGSEKSKVITDTAYSLTAYDDSHETMTLNAPYEEGTMSRKGDVTSRINEQDHVKPQVIFPAVVTVRDVTLPLFRYVLNNIARARRYGAQTTRTGSMTNHILGVALTDGEVFSNLKFTQRLYDVLRANSAIPVPDPVKLDDAAKAASELIPILLREDRVAVDQLVMGETEAWMSNQHGTTDEAVRAMLGAAFQDSRAYFEAFIKKADKGGKKASKK